jgi:predicted transcriptional regulator YdeE
MKKLSVQLEAKKFVGIKVRTNNKNEFDPKLAKIASCAQKFFSQNLAEKIAYRLNPGITFCIYSEYESDYTGEYSYFIGEETDNIENIAPDLNSLIIPPQKYIKFTSGTGSMPEVVINCWQKIWQMSPESLGGTRNYLADFEIYDERSKDPQNTILDIYIGIK